MIIPLNLKRLGYSAFVILLVMLMQAGDAFTASSEAAFLWSDTDEIAMTTGGVVNFTLSAGMSNANRNYLLLGSLSGREPGTPLPGGLVTLPLNWDAFTDFVLEYVNSPFFSQFQGTLDPTGMGYAAFNSQGPLPATMWGMTLYFAYLLYPPYDVVSNPVEIEVIHTTGWYYLHPHRNYAPSGLPDFDQRQDDWKHNGEWSHCGPTSAANILWWFDSRHADPTGTPGDGHDAYPLVAFHYPHSQDDHSADNVPPLVEEIAEYVETNQHGLGGTKPPYMRSGLEKYIKDAGLEDYYSVTRTIKPTFGQIKDWVTSDCGVLLQLYGFEGHLWRHWVAVAGVRCDGEDAIAISDPIVDDNNPGSGGSGHTEHNNAAIVSHDTYDVDSGPLGLIYYLEGYGGDGTIAEAVVIKEK